MRGSALPAGRGSTLRRIVKLFEDDLVVLRDELDIFFLGGTCRISIQGFKVQA